jgi:hypothetical protein
MGEVRNSFVILNLLTTEAGEGASSTQWAGSWTDSRAGWYAVKTAKVSLPCQDNRKRY